MVGPSLEVYLILIVIAVPVYFMIKWILNKTKFSPKVVKRLTWAGTFILTPSIYLFLIYAFIFYVSYYPTKEFNQKEWTENPSKRYEMTQDIIEKNLLIGKTKDEIVNLLGSDKYEYDGGHWGYNVGFVPGLLNIDPDVLDIYFKNNIVFKVDQHES